MTRWINRTVAPLIHIPSSSIYRFGDTPHTTARKTGAIKTAAPIIQDVQWTVHEDEMWAIVDSGSGGESGKDAIFKTLLGQLRLFPPPPPPGLFPLLSPPVDPYTSISLVSFRHHSGGPGGAFYDFTARYGAMRDDDQRVTLFESMFPQFLEMRMEREGRFAWQRHEGRSMPSAGKPDESLMTDRERRLFKDLIEKTGLESLLNVPIVTLSNGQTRRARIIKAVLKKPELLLLDEPLTGLDDKGRSQILALLRDLHIAKKPRIIMGLRAQDDIPRWITHVAFVNKGELHAGEKEKIIASVQQHVAMERNAALQNRKKTGKRKPNTTKGKAIVEMQNATVQYKDRTVLSSVSWIIRLGERWHLQGSNGSGKSTLLSLLTGAHPLSFTLPYFNLYGQKRSQIPTPLIQSRIGEMSPELFDAFPRRMPGMSVWAVVGTGFEGAFIERGREGVGVSSEDGGLGIGVREEGANELTWDGVNGDKWDEVKKWRIKRCWEVLEALGPVAWDHREGPSPLPHHISSVTKDFAHRRFVELSVGEQRVVLVMRALVGRPPLVLLDEALSGMSDGMVKAVKYYISSGGVGHDQTLIAISHWQEELPFEPTGLFRLADGMAAVHAVPSGTNE